MNYAKIGIILGLALFASPGFAGDDLAGLNCAEAYKVHEGVFSLVAQQYGDQMQRGSGAAAAAFLNGDLLAAAPADLSRSKAQLDSIEALLVAKHCPLLASGKGDWTLL